MLFKFGFYRLTRIQSLPNRVACSEYVLVKEKKEHSFWISIYSPIYQDNELASHWRSTVSFHDIEGNTLYAIHGIGADSLQALSSALFLASVKLVKINEGIHPLYFADLPDSNQSVISYLSTSSRSVIESEKCTDWIQGKNVIAELSNLKVVFPASGSHEFSISVFLPIAIEDSWYCTASFTGLDLSKTYFSNDSTRVLTKTFRGIHRQLIEWKKEGCKITYSDGDLLIEKSMNCFFQSKDKLVIIRTQEAVKHIRQKEFSKAIEILQELNRDSEFIPVLYLLGRAKEKRGDSEYILHFEEALDLKPKLPIEFLYKSKVCKSLGLPEKAEEYATQAEKLGCRSDYIQSAAFKVETLF